MTFPLGLGLLNGALFVGLIFYMLSVNRWVDRTDRVLTQTNRLQTVLIDAETGLRGYALTSNEEFLTPYTNSLRIVDEEFAKLRGLVGDNSVQIGRIGDIEVAFRDWLDYSHRLKEIAIKKGDVESVVAQQFGKRKMDGIRHLFSEFLEQETKVREERSEASQQAVYFLVLVFIAFSLAIGAVLAVGGRRQLMSLSEAYEESLRTQVEQNNQLQSEQWFKNGQNSLNEQIVGDRALKELAEQTLSFLSRYLGAEVATLYVSDGERYLERIANVAVPAEAVMLRGRLQFGESLVGQAAKDNRVLAVREIPRDYLNVSSALGETAPRHLLIAPISTGKSVSAVMEFGFMHEMDPRAEEFLSRVSEGISAAIKSAKYKEQLEKLLEELQSQAEELQSQQEELRVNNEELEEQTRMLKETQAQMESQQAELEQTNTQLEMQSRALEEQRDAVDRKNSDLLHAQGELEKKADELRVSSRYKSEFLANMSHELRTPLNSSLILAKLLAENKAGNLNQQQIDFAKQISSSGNDLLNLINDILDLSKVESGKLEINPEDFRLEALKKSLEKTFAPLAQERGIDFKVVIGEGAPTQMTSDRLRVEQIMKNLVSNAVKFTDRGGKVTVRLNAEPTKGSGPGGLEFAVEDSGIGIAPSQQEVIFEAFRQADGTTNRKYGGTGLGLSISRDLARLLGGAIDVKSTLGQGSTFTLSLPVTYVPVETPSVEDRRPLLKPVAPAIPAIRAIPSPQPPAGAEAKSSRPHMKSGEKLILIVEDDPRFSRILEELAGEMGFKTFVCDTASEGIEAAKEHHPDAVLLDLKLPDHSGLFVLDTLKQNPATRHIPVHVISARDFSRQALQMGAVGYALKPVRREELKGVFGGLEKRLKQDLRKVLIVEDDDVQRKAIRQLIEDDKMKLEVAATGGEALKAIEKEDFDCMIMDLNLPDMSGFDLLQKIGEDKDRPAPPIIVYTGRDLTRDEEARLRRYSQSIIIKGARSPERLLDEVTLFLHRVESQLAPERQKILENLRNREQLLEGKRILIADDDMRNTFALTAALEQKGAHIVLGKNGEEAIARLKDGGPVDLVLMDVMMPVMDGYQAMREIRKDARYQNLPIIALTAKAMKDDRDKCLEAGANDYLTKPVDIEKLVSLIRVWLSQGGARSHAQH